MATNSTQQATPADGTIEEVDGRHVLRFERRFRHPVEKVWDAITRPERITQWFGDGELDLDLVEGGEVPLPHHRAARARRGDRRRGRGRRVGRS